MEQEIICDKVGLTCWSWIPVLDLYNSIPNAEVVSGASNSASSKAALRGTCTLSAAMTTGLVKAILTGVQRFVELCFHCHGHSTRHR